MLWPRHLVAVMVAGCALAGAAPAAATVRYVDTGGDPGGGNTCTSPGAAACKTLQQALGLASSGDEITVAAGTYDVIDQPNVTTPVYLHGDLAGARPLVRGAGGLLYVQSTAPGTTVRHLAFESTNSMFGTNATLESDAGGVTFDDLDVDIDNGGSPVNMAAVFSYVASPASGTLTLSNSTVSANTNSSGPTVWAAAGQLVLRNVAIDRRGTNFTGVPALGASSAGPSPAPTIDAQNVQVSSEETSCISLDGGSGAGSVLKDITATQDAPGVQTFFDPCVVVDRTATLQNVTVNAPEAYPLGSPVCCNSIPALAVGWNSAPSAANVVLKNLTLDTNNLGLDAKAVSGLQVRGGRFRGHWAGIQLTGTLGVVSDAFTYGTGADSYGVFGQGGTSIRLRNLTAIGTGTGNGIYVDNFGTTVTVKNTIARGTGAGEDIATNNSATLTISNSNYVDSLANGGSAITDMGGHQTGDPLFANPMLFDYHVLAGSPVVDAGTTDSDLGATDIDGEARNQGAAPDIGADERPAPPVQPGDGGGGGGDGGGGNQPPAPTPEPGPTPPANQPAGTSNVPGPVVTISAAAVKITKTGVANVRIGCPATAAGACTGTLALQTATPVSTAAKKKIVKLGRRSFRLAAGKQAFVGVKLNRQGLKLLKKLKRLRVKAIADVHDANGAARITQRLLSLKLR